MRRTRWLAVFVALLLVVFHLGGGWYFADQLRLDALEVRPSVDELDIVVTEVGNGQVGLTTLEGEDSDLTDPGIIGLEWETGYGQLHEILAENPDGSVIRRLVRVEGELPAPGDMADLEGAAFPPDPTRAFGLFFREVSFPGPLGEMTAWEVLSGTGPWVIHVHGLRASRSEALRLVGPIAGAGFQQLVINYRNDEGQPADPSEFYQYGATEWEDVAAAVEYVVGKGATRVMLVGYSTGAAYIMSYLYRTNPNPVVAAVFDSPNIDFERAVDLGASQRSLPLVGLPVPPTLTWTAKQISSFRFGVDWGDLDYVERADQLAVPLLVFHGAEDETVPLSISRDLAEARPDLVRLVIVPGAGHVRSWNIGPESYERRLITYLEEMR